jgi:hypothetical protein
MPGLFSQFETDKKAEAEGVEFTFLGDDGEPVFRVRLARAGGANKLYDQVRERVSAPYRRLQKITDEVQHKISMEVFSEAVALPDTWEIKERDGLKCAGSEYGPLPKDPSDTNPNAPVEYGWLPEAPKGRSKDGFIRGIEWRGTIVPATVENVYKVMDALPDLYAMLVRESMSHAAYRKEALAEDSKNS